MKFTFSIERPVAYHSLMMSWFLIFIIVLILFAFSFSLWNRLIKVLDQNDMVYTPKVKKRILWEILFPIARLAVLSVIVHFVLLYLQG